MKKIMTAVAAMAMAATMFAVDFSTTVQLGGNIAKGTKDSVDLFSLDNKDQKDADLLEVHFAGDKAGADFKFWAQAKDGVSITPTKENNALKKDKDGAQVYGISGSFIQMRALDIWFCPVDAVKVTLGNVSSDLYKERLDWWKVPCGAHADYFAAWSPRWSSYSTVEGFGAKVDVNLDVLGGLSLGAGVIADDAWLKGQKDTDAVIGAYGAQAKLNVADGVSVGVAWRDAGTKEAKILTVGGDYAAGDFYGMLQARMYFDKKDGCWGDLPEVGLSGVAIDNYFSYNFGFMQMDGTFPVVIRGIRKEVIAADWMKDPSYMTARLRVGIPMDSVKVNCVIGTLGNDQGNNGHWVLSEDFGKTFNLWVNPSVDFNVGVCSLNVGAAVALADGGDTFKWYVPFSAKVAF